MRSASVAFDRQRQVGHPHIEESLVTEIGPVVPQQATRHGDNGIDDGSVE